MTTEEALLAAVLAAPDDDLPRLVLADHYEGELGQPERAEFIRVQCEIAKSCSCIHDWRSEIDWSVFRPRCGRTSGKCPDTDKLRRRERELWMPPGAAHTAVIRDLPTGFSAAPESWLSGPPHAIVRRGFISEVHCTLAEWCGSRCERVPGESPCDYCHGVRTHGIGPQIVRRHPVTKVVLTDREPWQAGNHWSWWIEDTSETQPDMVASSLPREVFRLIHGHDDNYTQSRAFPTREDADKAASDAIIAWAKSQPLTTADSTLEMMSSHP